ncbi:MAG: sterol desaturase family protein [Bauldia sp.]
MRLSRFGYYGDFFIYPVAAPALATAAILTAPPQAAPILAAVVAGVGLWTFIEYLLHRFVLHHVPYIKEMHDAHHNDQEALIGAPTWLSMTIMFLIVFLPLDLVLDFTWAAGITAGVALGYLWYVTTHHAVHHWKFAPDGYGMRLKRRHALHHHFDEKMNFGVTSGFWDKVFGTDVTPQVIAARRAANRAAREGQPNSTP